MSYQPIPHKQDNQRANRRADQASALVEPVPADGLTEKRSYECSGYSQRRGQYETLGIAWPGRKHARDDAGKEADYDNPNDVKQGNLPR